MKQVETAIRESLPDDLTELTALMGEMGYPSSLNDVETRFAQIFSHPDYKTLVAVTDGEIVGMAGLYKGLFYEMNGLYLRVVTFVVKPGSRKRGIGKLLLSAAEAWAVAQGLSSVYINCGNRPERAEAQQFYYNNGYSVKSSGFVKRLPATDL